MTRGLRHGRFGRRLSHVSLGKDLGEIRFRRSPRADFKALRCHCTVHGAGVVAGSDFAKFCVCVASAHQIGHLEHLDRPTLMPEASKKSLSSIHQLLLVVIISWRVVVTLFSPTKKKTILFSNSILQLQLFSPPYHWLPPWFNSLRPLRSLRLKVLHC